MRIELELEKMGENSVRASKDIRSLNERDKNNILKSIIVSFCLLYTSPSPRD